MYASYEKATLLNSYLAIRKFIGYIAVSIPFLLVIGSVLVGNCDHIQSSISDYYHTPMRDVLVGTICAIALFLFCYTGYDMYDFSATKLAAIFALGVAFFPTAFNDEMVQGCHTVREFQNPIISKIHLTSAFLFFVTLSIISIFLFTKSGYSKRTMGIMKQKRNRIYRRSGYTMILCLVLLVLYFMLKDGLLTNTLINTRFSFLVTPEFIAKLKGYDVVFWLESVALFAFGISWLTKGKIFYKDKRVRIY